MNLFVERHTIQFAARLTIPYVGAHTTLYVEDRTTLFVLEPAAAARVEEEGDHRTNRCDGRIRMRIWMSHHRRNDECDIVQNVGVRRVKAVEGARIVRTRVGIAVGWIAKGEVRPSLDACARRLLGVVVDWSPAGFSLLCSST